MLELSPDLVGPSVTKNQGIIGEGVDLTVAHLEDTILASERHEEHADREQFDDRNAKPGC